NETVSFLGDYHMKETTKDRARVQRVLGPIWKIIWKTWCNIGHHVGVKVVEPSTTITTVTNGTDASLSSNSNHLEAEKTTTMTVQTPGQVNITSQKYLCLLVKSLYSIVARIYLQMSEQ